MDYDPNECSMEEDLDSSFQLSDSLDEDVTEDEEKVNNAYFVYWSCLLGLLSRCITCGLLANIGCMRNSINC